MIKLNNGYFIVIDALNYTLKQTYISTGKDGQVKEFTRTIGYFGNMRQLMGRYLEHCQKDEIGQSEVDLMEYVKMVEESNRRAISGLDEVLGRFPVK